MVSTRSVLNSTSVEVAAPHKKLKVSTTRRRSVPNASSSTSRPVAVPKEQQISTISTEPLEIPQSLYDLIQKVAKFTESLKVNPDNRFAKRKLKYYEPCMRGAVAYHRALDELPLTWKYDPETFFMAHVPKPPTPSKPKPKTKKKIKITWKSYNYHGSYSLNYDELKVWNSFRMTEKAESNEFEEYPYREHLHTVGDVMVVDLLGKFAINTFNKSCQMYVNKDEDNQVSGAEFMECKFYKLTSKYIFYMTIEAIEQGIHGVYKTRVECVTENGAMTLQNFVVKDREPKWNRPWVKPRLEPEVVYETVQDGSSDPQDFYKLTGMVHRETEGGGFNYHNPAFSAHIIIYTSSKDKKAKAFEPNPGSNSSYPPQSGYGVPQTSQPGYGTQPSGYGSYGPPPTQKPPCAAAAQIGYAQPAYGAPPAYSTAGYAQPSYGAQQPPVYGGSYGGVVINRRLYDWYNRSSSAACVRNHWDSLHLLCEIRVSQIGDLAKSSEIWGFLDNSNRSRVQSLFFQKAAIMSSGLKLTHWFGFGPINLRLFNLFLKPHLSRIENSPKKGTGHFGVIFRIWRFKQVMFNVGCVLELSPISLYTG
uniref:40S ribosomal protein S13 n=1 Tax=Tanacetum cinerariifolium TaxID=118510 RepID=A0A6L2NAB9_TANCI|nr:40S ribosomal protein S13 [Tanacetum cinerariifolium]